MNAHTPPSLPEESPPISKKKTKKKSKISGRSPSLLCHRAYTGRPRACRFFFALVSSSFWSRRLISCVFNGGAYLAFNTRAQVDKAQGEGNKPPRAGKPLPKSSLLLRTSSQHQWIQVPYLCARAGWGFGGGQRLGKSLCWGLVPG